MKDRTTSILETTQFWTACLTVFFMAIAPAPMNIFMGICAAAYLASRLLRRGHPLLKLPVRPFLILLLAVTYLSAFNSIDFWESMSELGKWIHGIFLACACALTVRPGKRLLIFCVFALCGATLASLDAFWQLASGTDFIRGYGLIENIGLFRATASFKDANMLGIYLSALWPLGVGLYFMAQSRKSKFLWAALSAVIFAGIAVTYSRPSLLAAYCALWVFAAFRRSRVLTALLLAVTLLSPLLMPRSVKEWARQLQYNPVRLMCNDDRIAVYLNSLNMIKAHPWVGVGAGTFMSSYRYYKNQQEYRGVVTLAEMKAHNNFLHLAGEIGLIGLALFAGLLAIFYRACLHRRRILADKNERILLESVLVAFTAFLINGLTESSLYYSRVSPLFWILLGLGCGFLLPQDARGKTG